MITNLEQHYRTLIEGGFYVSLVPVDLSYMQELNFIALSQKAQLHAAGVQVILSGAVPVCIHVLYCR